MNIKSKLHTLLILMLSLCLALSLVACGSSSAGSPANTYESSSNAADYSAAPMAAPAADQITISGKGRNMSMESDVVDSAVQTDNTDTQPPASNRKLVKNAQMALETKEFDTAIPSLIKMIESAGGYVENQSTDGRSMNASVDYYEREASITARIPADKLSSVTSQAGEICNVSSQNESVDDITDRYFDAAAHLDMLKVQETRLLELLGKAETLENIIQLEQALTNCQYEIESLSGQIRRMDSQVSYSTLHMTINEVVDYTVPQEKPKNFVDRLGEAFIRSGKNLATATEGILFFLIIDGPVLAIYLLFWGFIVYLGYCMVYKRRPKTDAKHKKYQPTPTPEIMQNSDNKEE